MIRAALLLALVLILAAGESGTVILSLSGELPLRRPPSVFGDAGWELHTAAERWREALAGRERRIVLDLSRGFRAGLASAEALAALVRQRPPGRRIACLLGDVGDSALIVAAACDEVVVDAAAILGVRGLAAEVWYAAEALAKLGIRCHAVASGPYKTAAEPFTRSGPSDAAREELQRIVAALDRSLRALAERPGFAAEALAELRRRGLSTAEDAVQAGLARAAVDGPGWLAAQPPPLRRLRPRSELPDLTTWSGLWELWTRWLGGGTRPRGERVIAVVELSGLIVPDWHSLPGELIADADTIALLERLRSDPRVAAVVVRLDSGGGEAAASERIHRAMRRLDAAKPVVALIDAAAASGAYWIACGAREILAHRTSLTGSIGAFVLVPDLDGAADLLGLRRHVERSAPLADLLHPGGWDAEREAAWRRLVAAIDERFRAQVAERRRLPRPRLDALAEGRVFTGEQALAAGLVDGIGSLPQAVARAAALAGVPETLPLERLPRAGGWLARLGLAETFGPSPARLAAWRALLADGPRVLAFEPLASGR